MEKMLISFEGGLIGPAVNIIAHYEEKNTCVKQQCEINFVPAFAFEWLKQDYCWAQYHQVKCWVNVKETTFLYLMNSRRRMKRDMKKIAANDW